MSAHDLEGEEKGFGADGVMSGVMSVTKPNRSWTLAHAVLGGERSSVAVGAIKIARSRQDTVLRINEEESWKLIYTRYWDLRDQADLIE